MRRLRLRALPRDRRGAVSIMFAFSLIPMVTSVALAVDYSFYVQARSQLNLAADAAAMHAVRVASQSYSLGYLTAAAEQQAGALAGQQWFAAQLGTLASGSISASNINVAVAYSASPGTFTSTVSYTATVPTHIGNFIVSSWSVSNTASAVISNAYVEILFLLDDSSSMLIGATTSDIVAIETATICSAASANEGQGMGNYSWYYNSGYGYPLTGSQRVPPLVPVNGACDPNYDGAAAACFYVPSSGAPISPLTGLCTNGGGATANGIQHVPQAPCAFACHDNSTNNDYYGLARSLTPAVTLRLDVVEQAAASVIQTLQTQQQFPNQFSVGVYEFNNTLSSVFPGPGQGEASSNLAGGLLTVQALSPALSSDVPNTYFSTVAASLAASLTSNGNGLSPTTPQKNLFIVTDGLADYYTSGGARVMGPMTNPANEQTCQAFKNLGINVYVLYTPYLPIPNPFYVSNDKQYVEPQATSPVMLALQACASSPANFFQASDPTAINTAMQKMLLAALNSPGRIAQ